MCFNFRYIRGYLKLKITGDGCTRFINICSKRGIRLWDMIKCEDGYFLNILICDFRIIREIVRKTKVKAVIVSKHGLPFLFVKMSCRKVFVFGAIACFCMLYILKNYIWGIEINGNTGITDDMIMEYLENNDITMGTPIDTIDTEVIEKMLRKDFDNITWVSVGQQGTALTIDIKERDVATYPREEYLASNLYAVHSGTVESIIVRNGIPKVKIGDTVEAGQLLVEGILPIVKTDGTILGYNLVNADADIIITYSEPYHDEISLYIDEKTYTGETTKEVYIRIGNKTLAFHLFSAQYEKDEFAQTFSQMELWENFYLPIWIGVGEHKEYVLTRKKINEDAGKVLLEEELSIFLKTLEEKGVQNLQKDVKISISGSMLIMSGEILYADTNVLREELNASFGTELENGQYNSIVNGNEH